MTTKEIIDKAHRHLAHVCSRNGFQLRAHVPARPDEDDDLVIGDALRTGRQAVDAIEYLLDRPEYQVAKKFLTNQTQRQLHEAAGREFKEKA